MEKTKKSNFSLYLRLLVFALFIISIVLYVVFRTSFDKLSQSLSNSTYTLQDMLTLLEYNQRINLMAVFSAGLGLTTFGMILTHELRNLDSDIKEKNEMKENLKD